MDRQHHLDRSIADRRIEQLFDRGLPFSSPVWSLSMNRQYVRLVAVSTETRIRT
jgi:hypothetical protein